jgi:5-methylcytosine-specific restriction endonuclease McrA
MSPAGVRLTTLEVSFPRFVLSEFNTHRTFCLDGDTKLYFDLPTKIRKSATRRFTITLREFHEKWHNGAAPRVNRPKTKSADKIEPQRLYTSTELAALVGYADYTGVDLLTRRLGVPRVVTPGERYRVRGADIISYLDSAGTNRQPIRERLAAMDLRSCNEVTGEIYHTHVSDVCFSGKKPVFRVTLENGQQIVSTKDHLFLTNTGWQRLEDALSLTLTPGNIAAWSGKAELAVNGIEAYKDPKWLAGMLEYLSIPRVARHVGATVDQVKFQCRKHGIKSSGSTGIAWKVSHPEPPWNRGKRYCNIKLKGRRSAARVRRGAESHLWRGGITPERRMIGAWTQHEAFRTHRSNAFRCVLCGSGRRLHTHHLDPVAHNPSRAYDTTNLTSLCDECHVELHARNVELMLLDHSQAGLPLREFWERIGGMRLRKPYIPKKKRAMVRHFVAVKTVEYVGERDTYDIEVEGPYHNFVADGFIVHNSRNSASSRAIPTSKLIERLESDPVLPLEWGRNKAGMSADDVLTPEEVEEAKRIWLSARDAAVAHARRLLELKVHKQELNRVLEPFLWHVVIVTATEFENFFALRCAPQAQPEIRAAAILMRTAIDGSSPGAIAYGQWHLPLVQEDERQLDIETQKKISAARCARVSYLTHDGKREIEKDLELHDRLKGERHLSPFEHVATPAPDAQFHANFRGWLQMRHEIEAATWPSLAVRS